MAASGVLVENAKVMAKGQITLPKDIRKSLGVGLGDRVTMVCRGNQVVMMNSLRYAMNVLQEEMKGEWEKAGIHNDDDILALMKDIRQEVENEWQ